MCCAGLFHPGTNFSGKRVYQDLAQIVGPGTTDLEIENT